MNEAISTGGLCLEAAKLYRSLNLSPLIICPHNHVGCGKTHSKHCSSHGKAPWGPWKEFQTRIATELELDQKWHDLPNGNVGVALGEVSGIVRIDVDGTLGEQKLAELSGGDLPDTWEFTSGRENAGRGLLYAVPRGMRLKTTVADAGKKEELRLQANGAQTVLPPSRHASGSVYAWKPGHGPLDRPAASAPAWLLAALSAGVSQGPGTLYENGNNGAQTVRAPFTPKSDDPPEVQDQFGHRTPQLSGRFKIYTQNEVPEGERDDTLYKEAVALWGEQVRLHGQQALTDASTEVMVFRRLMGLNTCYANPPLSAATIQEKVKSAQRFLKTKQTENKTYQALSSLGLEWKDGEWWPGEWRVERIMETDPIFRIHTPGFTIDLSAGDYNSYDAISVRVMAKTGICLYDRPREWPAIWNGWEDRKAKTLHRGLKAKLLDNHTEVPGAPDVRRQTIIAEKLIEYLERGKKLDPGVKVSGIHACKLQDGSYTFPFGDFFSEVSGPPDSITRTEINAVLNECGIISKGFKLESKATKYLRLVTLAAKNALHSSTSTISTTNEN